MYKSFRICIMFKFRYFKNVYALQFIIVLLGYKVISKQNRKSYFSILFTRLNFLCWLKHGVSVHLSGTTQPSRQQCWMGWGSVMKGDFVLKNGFPQGAIDSPSHPPLGLKGQTPLYNSSEQEQAYITGDRLLNHIQIALLSHRCIVHVLTLLSL